eukprot:2658780-Pyramimonas_sp.AAC.1
MRALAAAGQGRALSSRARLFLGSKRAALPKGGRGNDVLQRPSGLATASGGCGCRGAWAATK